MLDKVQAYFENELTQDEKEAFQKELEINPALREEVELYKKIRYAIRAEGMKQALDAMHFETTATSDPPGSFIKRKNKWNNPWVLIIGLGLIGVLAWVMLKKSDVAEPQPKKAAPVHLQYAQDIKSLEGLPVTLSATNDNTFFAEGMVSYRRKDFVTAIQLFEAASQQGISSDTLNIYLANAYLASDRDEEAKILLEYISENQQSPYYEASLWYLTKYYLKQKNMEEAKSLLAKIAALEGAYTVKANEMLDGLQ